MPVQHVESREPEFEVALFCDMEVLQYREILIDGLGPAELRDSERRVAIRHVRREDECRLVQLGDTRGNCIAGIPGWVNQGNGVARSRRKTGSWVARAEQILIRGNA